MNLTLSVDEQTVREARKTAEAMGKSLNQVVREYLESLAGQTRGEQWEEEFKRLFGEPKGNSKGWKFNRDEIHERS